MSNLFAHRVLYVFVLASIMIAPGVPTASSQDIIESLLEMFQPPPRVPPPQVSSYAEPNLPPDPLSENRTVRDAGGPFVAYCVRLCDGFFFPLPRNFAVSPAEQCRSFCPAARTKVFGGNGITQATSADGGRYAALDTALLYRKRLVDNCTCNGRDAFGLARLDIANDLTLRPGDIVATNAGFLAYAGPRSARRNADFTPVSQYSGLSSDARKKLSETKVLPARQIAARNSMPIEMKPISHAERRAQLLR